MGGAPELLARRRERQDKEKFKVLHGSTVRRPVYKVLQGTENNWNTPCDSGSRRSHTLFWGLLAKALTRPHALHGHTGSQINLFLSVC